MDLDDGPGCGRGDCEFQRHGAGHAAGLLYESSDPGRLNFEKEITTMFTTSFRDTCLGQLGGFIGLIKTISNWRAGTVTEAAYTGYGTRPAVTWSAAEDTSPAGGRQKKNTAAVTFPQNTGANEDQIAFGVYSASTAGTLHAIGLLDTDVPLF